MSEEMKEEQFRESIAGKLNEDQEKRVVQLFEAWRKKRVQNLIDVLIAAEKVNKVEDTLVELEKHWHEYWGNQRVQHAIDKSLTPTMRLLGGGTTRMVILGIYARIIHPPQP